MTTTIPTMTGDRLLFTFQRMGVAEFVIQMDLSFDRRLDPERLQRAFFLTLEAHPVLGCRFVPDPGRPWWEPAELDPRAFTVVTSPEDADRFLLQWLDHLVAPQFRTCLHQGPDGDRLLLKVSHCASDTGGLKETAATLAAIYCRLASDPDYRPTPSHGSRSFTQITDRVPLLSWPRILWNYLSQSWNLLVPRQTHTWRWRSDRPDRPLTFVVRELSPARVRELSEWGRGRGATLNDLIIAAYFRAQALAGGWDGKSRLRMQTTIDLRRWYLPDQRGEEVCNLSAYLYPHIGRELGATFADTVDRIAADTRRQKKSWPGLTEICLGPIFRRLSLHSIEAFSRKLYEMTRNGSFPNGLTNLGPIRPEDVDFEGLPVRALIHPPPVYPPMLMGGLSGYNGGLALSFGGAESHADEIARFLDALLAELPAADKTG